MLPPIRRLSRRENRLVRQLVNAGLISRIDVFDALPVHFGDRIGDPSALHARGSVTEQRWSVRPAHSKVQALLLPSALGDPMR